MLWQEVKGLLDFRCYLHVASLSLTPIICHVLVYCFLLISIARYLQEFAFEGQNMTLTVNVLFTRITYCDAGPGCEVGKCYIWTSLFLHP